MGRPLRLAGAAVLLAAAALVTACTGDGTTPSEAGAPWALDGLAAAPVAPSVQASVDAPPAKGTAKILGIAEVEGTDVVLAVRNDICEVAFLAAPLTGAAATAPISVGAQRPTGSVYSDSHQGFPGNVLTGKYTQASAQFPPLRFVAVGCSEKAMAVRVEGAGASGEARKKAGDSLRTWRDGQDLVMTVGNPEAIHRVPASTS
ncbi:hypothetical protein [Kitasatospora purpeofusca]|uniref:hypothetical protein n=1 Tax=Kitasatospora purpeofusca TaxID=67352 RepID=UPI002252F7E1|nr:hypothetical protein [Kitasatospora purpeofusca]MCX4758926.1 hypothetical protein [Kitasatospora purpeofusca]WSR30651.1 hypothetical protein OG715_06540 [Kitasatospora purpeofusca]